MKIPKTIKNCPIEEAVVEIRFESGVDSEAIFGIVSTVFADKYTCDKWERLPILDLPLGIRKNDPTLSYQPYCKISAGKFILQIGPRAISIVNKGTYVGWDKFEKEILEIYGVIKDTKIVTTVERLGVRYINFFEGLDIFTKTKLQINEPLPSTQKLIKSNIPAQEGEISSTLIVANNVNITEEKNGSVIDIDTYVQSELNDFLDNPSSSLKKCHDEEKIVFYSLLTDDFISSLDPEY